MLEGLLDRFWKKEPVPVVEKKDFNVIMEGCSKDNFTSLQYKMVYLEIPDNVTVLNEVMLDVI